MAIGAWQDPLALIAEKIRSGLRDRETHTYTLETGNRSMCIKVDPSKQIHIHTHTHVSGTEKGTRDAGLGTVPPLEHFVLSSFYQSLHKNHLNTQTDLTYLQLQHGNLLWLAVLFL